ncbi:MAG: ATP-binding protein [Thiohalocapsa sp.]|jgi:serine/threonine-protein kinase RsbW|uniref:ATP-binding protein n=1 Tax=Thiohalocapsa sp. TaxID=2497641 RepID=UPI0025F67A13|nr:ATP-binding protein [Thiohalocapsa sp.]MCG6943172.1 ATP-binding protein [Thiohalocapsa sp.]
MQRAEIDFTSDPDNTAWHGLIEQRLIPLARGAGFDELVLFGLQLALVEAVNNIIEHAYDMARGQPIAISGECAADALRYRLRDRGQPMPLPLPPGAPAAPDASGGRGWQIIRAGFPDVSYTRRDDINLLTLSRPVPEKP